MRTCTAKALCYIGGVLIGCYIFGSFILLGRHLKDLPSSSWNLQGGIQHLAAAEAQIVLTPGPKFVPNLRGVDACSQPAEELQHDQKSLGIDEVVFGVLTCSIFHRTRLQAIQQTWLRHVRNVLVFSDREPDHGVGVEVLVGEYLPNRNETLYRNGAWRVLPMVEAMYARYPEAKWYFIVDDDTYVFVSSLLQELLAPRDPTVPQFVGWPFPAGSGLTNVGPGQFQPSIAHGGAGMVISHALMVKLAAEAPRCRQKYSWNWPGDVRLAQCVEDLGSRVEADRRLHPESLETELTQHPDNLRGLPPFTYHHLPIEHLHQLYDSHVVYSADQMFRADFADFAMSTPPYDPPAFKNFDYKFRLVFGWHVQVIKKSWANAFFANRLLRFDSVPAPKNSTHQFEQEYGGDLCEDGKPLTVVVQIRCGICEKAKGKVDGPMLCKAEVQDVCRFVLDLALPCPAWEANVPLGLDAGTAPSLSNVVRAGRPMFLWSHNCSARRATSAVVAKSSLSEVAGDVLNTTFYFTLSTGTIALKMPIFSSGSASIVTAKLGVNSSLQLRGGGQQFNVSGEVDALDNRVVVEYWCHKRGRTWLRMELPLVGYQTLVLEWWKTCPVRNKLISVLKATM